MTAAGSIRRGCVYRARLPELGVRPVLVVSWNALNVSLRAPVVCHLTTSERERMFPTVVSLSAGEAELEHDSFVLCHELHTVKAEAFREEIGELSEERMLEVDLALAATLDLPA